MTYQYLTGMHIPWLVNVCSIFAAVSLEAVIIGQIRQGTVNFWSKAALFISTAFLVFIAFALYVPSGLYDGGVISARTYSLVTTLATGSIHSVFALLILCVSLSKQHAQVGVLRHIQEYKAAAADGVVCPDTGRVYKSERGLKIAQAARKRKESK